MNEYVERLQNQLTEAEAAAYWSYKSLQKLQDKVSPEDFRLALADVALQKCHELFAEREARLLNEEAQP